MLLSSRYEADFCGRQKLRSGYYSKSHSSLGLIDLTENASRQNYVALHGSNICNCFLRSTDRDEAAIEKQFVTKGSGCVGTNNYLSNISS